MVAVNRSADFRRQGCRARSEHARHAATMRPAGSDQPVDEPHAKSQLFAPSFCLQAPLQVLVSIDEFRARSLTGFPDVEGIETKQNVDTDNDQV